MRSKTLLFSLLIGCTSTATTERVEPTSIVVTLQGDPASAESPLPFPRLETSQRVTVQTFDKDGDPYPFEGDLSLRVRPGKLEQSQWITLSDGQWEGDVVFRAAYGPTRIWAGDEGDKDSSTGRTPSYATGVSEAIHYAFPTIREMNEIDDHETNNLAGEFAELRVSDRNVIVTVIGANGFWVTDTDDEPGTWNSLYVYSFSKPQGIWEGARLTTLMGNTQEYLATTQLSFPVYLPDGDLVKPLPEAIELDPSSPCDNDVMEGMEGSLVSVSDASVPSDFTSGSEDWSDYLEYGQWPLSIGDGGCPVYADSTTVPGFDPTTQAGQEIGTVTGMLREIWGKWIITAREDSDIGGGGFEDDRRPDPNPDRPGIAHATARHKPGTEPVRPYEPRLVLRGPELHDHAHPSPPVPSPSAAPGAPAEAR